MTLASGRHISGLIFLLLFGSLWGGCEGEVTEVELSPVSAPPGGAVCALEGPASTGPTLAVTDRGIFQREDGGTWKLGKRKLRWQGEDGSLDYVTELCGENPEAVELVAVDGAYFLLRSGQDNNQALLFQSADGLEWNRTTLPEPYSEKRSADQKTGQKFNVVKPPSLRVDEVSKTLYLLANSKIWRRRIPESDEHSQWKQLSLDGTVLSEEAKTSPVAIQAYLPRNKGREFELLAVFQEQLLLYRRPKDGDWTLTSVRPEPAHRIHFANGVAYLVTAERIYQAGPPFERWTPVRGSGFKGNSVASGVFQRNSSEVVAVADRKGRVFCSKGPKRDEWVRFESPGGRVRDITDLNYSGRAERLLVATAGSGIWNREKNSWTKVNRGLRAASILDFESSSQEAWYAASDAGVFKFDAQREQPDWKNLSDVFTTEVERTENGVVVGTKRGRVLHYSSKETKLDRFELPENSGGARSRVVNLKRFENPGNRYYIRDASERSFLFDSKTQELTRLTWNSDFRDILRDSRILKTLGVGESLYLVTESLNAPSTQSLWKVDLSTSVYTAMEVNSIDSSPETSSILHAVREESDVSVYWYYDDSLDTSVDNGLNWKTRKRDWGRGRVAAYSDRSELHTYFVQSQYQDRLFVFRHPLDSKSVESYRIDWPENWQRTRVGRIAIGERTLLVKGESLFRGTIPELETRISNGLVVILTITGVVLVTAFGFVVLKVS